VLPLSIYSIPSLPQGLPVDAYVFFIVFPSLLSFPLSFRLLGVLEGSSKWFHSLSILTTVPPFLNEIRISANSCSTYQCVRLCEFHTRGSLDVADSNTSRVLICKTELCSGDLLLPVIRSVAWRDYVICEDKFQMLERDVSSIRYNPSPSIIL